MTLSAASLLLALIVAELVVRALFPSYRFLDPNQDCFWTLRAREMVLADPDVRQMFGSGQYDARIGWRPQANLRSRAQNTNGRGIRGVQNHDYPRARGRARLVAHGDSFTWGLGVSDTETYSSRLAALRPGSEVINMGVNGHGIDQQYLYWLAEGIQYQPDVIVLGFYVPDFHRSALSIREFPKPRFVRSESRLKIVGSPVPTPKEYLDDCAADCRSTSRLGDVVSAALRRFRSGEANASLESKSQLTRAILAAWRDSLAWTRTELYLVVIPHARYRDYPDHEHIEAVLRESADENAFTFLNLTDPLLEFESRGTPAYSRINGHWTSAGHRFAARQIAAALGPQRMASQPTE